MHYSCITAFNLGRVSIDSSFNKIKDLKSEESFFDHIYGLPRSFRNLPPAESLLPLFKFNDLFKKIYSILESKKVEINLNSSVSVSSSAKDINNISIKVNNEE